jgi:hypothetical protein
MPAEGKLRNSTPPVTAGHFSLPSGWRGAWRSAFRPHKAVHLPPLMADGRSANRGPSRAGEFNTFFVKFDGLPFRTDMATSSGAMVDGWTGNVHGLVTVGGNSVDQWTGMVYWLK